MWVIQNEDTNLPKWLTDNLSGECECGSPIENFYNANGEITSTRCTNKQCPYVLMKKVKTMCHDFLKSEGIGDAKSMQVVKDNNLTCHFDAVPILYKQKPRVSLYDIMRMCFIEGIDTGWKRVIGNAETYDELIKDYYGEYRSVLLANEALIRKAESVFDVIKTEKPLYEPLVTGTVMLSGSFKGLRERNSFIYAMNKMSKGMVNISISESKRKTGIMALIQEADSPNRGKAACAIENGIPIMTPVEFNNYICSLLKKRLEEKNRKER